MASKNTGVKGVLEDYRQHLKQQQDISIKETIQAIKQGSILRVEQEDYTFGVSEYKPRLDRKLLLHVNDEEYLEYMENDQDYLFVVMVSENDEELICNVISTLAKKFNIKCIIYTSQLVTDKSVTPMCIRYGNVLPCFLNKYQHQLQEKEDLENIVEYAEYLMLQYGLVQE